MRVAQRVLLAACALLALACGFLAIVSVQPPAPERLVFRPLPAQATTQPAVTGGVNINTASMEQLQQLPGISRKLAQLIVEARAQHPFHFVEDLRVILGIGEKRVEALRPLLYFPEELENP